jgi:hypothetical protein
MIKNEENNEEFTNIYFHLKFLLSIIFTLVFLLYFFKNNICSHNFYKKKKIGPTKYVNGKITYFCGLCGKEYIEIIPKLNKKDYIVEKLTSNCMHGKGEKYILKKKKEIFFIITDNHTLPHTIYGDKCKVCHQNIGEFNFKKIGNIVCDGYPRLYKLSNYWNNTWLLGGDNGTILCRRSEDEGHHWSDAVKVSNFPNHICTNVDFFELPNHDIICSYRAIGKNLEDPKIKYNRKLFSSISKDGGKSWKDLGLIIDNFILSAQLGKTLNDAFIACINEGNIGFFEPFVSFINNVITVIYADDFTPMLLSLIGSVDDNKKTQSIYSQTFNIKTYEWSKERKIIINGYLKKSPTKSGLIERISRDGMPVLDIMKDGTYVMVFEGTYRNYNYTYFTNNKLEEYHPFEILISYSKDGINWSNPVEVYVPKNDGSKCSAPYICITENNQLVISFQTDEDSITSGYKGDLYSIMKVIISKPGIKIEDINKDSFYAVVNNNNSPIGGQSLWSGMMLVGNKIYTCSSGCPLLYSELPSYAEPEQYSNKLKEDYCIKNGKVDYYGNKIIILEKESLIINKRFNTSVNNSFSCYVRPNTRNDCGLIFGIDNFEELNLSEINYYLFLIKENGYLALSKFYEGLVYDLLPKSKEIFNNFNKFNNYKMTVNFNSLSGDITTSINNIIVFKANDKSLKGNKIGILCDGIGAIFTQILPE